MPAPLIVDAIRINATRKTNMSKSSEFNERLKSLITFPDKPVSVVDHEDKRLLKSIEELIKKMESAPNEEN